MYSQKIVAFTKSTIALIVFALAFTLALPSMAQEAPSREQSRVEAGQHRVDINSASLEELMSIPGIGPVLAERIIASRNVRPFRLPHELVRVNGIGEATLQKLLPYITTKQP